jgi:hypothetical protein
MTMLIDSPERRLHAYKTAKQTLGCVDVGFRNRPEPIVEFCSDEFPFLTRT